MKTYLTFALYATTAQTVKVLTEFIGMKWSPPTPTEVLQSFNESESAKPSEMVMGQFALSAYI